MYCVSTRTLSRDPWSQHLDHEFWRKLSPWRTQQAYVNVTFLESWDFSVQIHINTYIEYLIPFCLGARVCGRTVFSKQYWVWPFPFLFPEPEPPASCRPPQQNTANTMNNMSTNNNSTLQTIHHLLGSTLLLTMTDGRTATGKFTSLDRLGNVILSEVCERREVGYDYGDASDGGNTNTTATGDKKGNQIMTATTATTTTWNTKRYLSQAVIPGEKVLKVQIAKREWDTRIQHMVERSV